MSEWIKVGDMQPQDDFDVLVACDDDVFIDTFRQGYIEGDFWFDSEREDERITITHWMPLPEPPRGEEE